MQAVVVGELRQPLVAEAGRFATEHDHVAGRVADVVVPSVRRATRRGEPSPILTQRRSARRPRIPDRRVGELVIVESTAAQRGTVQIEAERPHEMQPGTHVRAEADDVSRVRGDLRFDEHDLEHCAHCAHNLRRAL